MTMKDKLQEIVDPNNNIKLFKSNRLITNEIIDMAETVDTINQKINQQEIIIQSLELMISAFMSKYNIDVDANVNRASLVNKASLRQTVERQTMYSNMGTSLI